MSHDLSARPFQPGSPQPAVLPWRLQDTLNLALTSAVALLITWRLFAPGIPNRADMLMGVYRIFELASAWQEGLFYPRLGPHLNFTYGAPLFQFYPPLVSYLGLFLHWCGLDLIAASKITLVGAVLLAGVGAYICGRALFMQRGAALLSALVYCSAPYVLTNVFERGAAAETLAVALIPWLFWALRSVVTEDQRWHIWLAGGCVAGMMLAHNITALFVVPAAIAYCTLLAIYEKRPASLIRLFCGVLLGLGLSAFYWLPAVTEIRFTRASAYMLNESSDVTQNLLSASELVQPALAFEYQGPLRFRFALRQVFFGALGLLALPFLNRRTRFEMVLLALGWAVVMLLQMQITQFFWQYAPMVRFIQFSWRLFGIASFCTAMLAGALFATPWLSRRTGWLFIGFLAGIGLWASLHNIRVESLPFWYKIDETNIHLRDLYERGRQDFPLFGDYSPLALSTNPGSLARPRNLADDWSPPLAMMPMINVIEENFAAIKLAVSAPAPFALHLHRIYFPGWQVYVNSQEVPTTPSGQIGLVTAELPAGDYTAMVRFDQTPVRRVGDLLSLLSLAVVGAFLLPLPGRLRALRMAVAVLLLTGLLLFYSFGRGRTVHQPVPYPVNFQDEVHLLGFTLEGTSWRAGETVALRLYWLTQVAPRADYKIFIHVATLDDMGKVAQFDSAPVLDASPMTRWEAGELVVDEHLLVLDPATPSGRYRLLMGVYHPETVQNLQVRSAPHVLPGERVLLTEVEIDHE